MVSLNKILSEDIFLVCRLERGSKETDKPRHLHLLQLKCINTMVYNDAAAIFNAKFRDLCRRQFEFFFFSSYNLTLSFVQYRTDPEQSVNKQTRYYDDSFSVTSQACLVFLSVCLVKLQFITFG